jgi:hypothetical protein
MCCIGKAAGKMRARKAFSTLMIVRST